MIFAMTILVPFLSAAYTSSLVFAVLASFFLIHLLVTLHELAAALEDPFKPESHQFTFTLLQKRFNERVLATAFAERPVAFTDVSTLVAPAHIPAMHAAGAPDGPRGGAAPPAVVLHDERAGPKAAGDLDDGQNQVFASSGRKGPKLHHVSVQAADQGSLHEASMKEGSNEEHSLMSRSSSSVFREASGSLDRIVHEPLQFGFDEDDGGVGGNVDGVAAADFDAIVLQTTSAAIRSSELNAEQHHTSSHSNRFDSTTVSYDSPALQHPSNMHGSHAIDEVVTLQGAKEDKMFAATTSRHSSTHSATSQTPPHKQLLKPAHESISQEQQKPQEVMHGSGDEDTFESAGVQNIGPEVQGKGDLTADSDEGMKQQQQGEHMAVHAVVEVSSEPAGILWKSEVLLHSSLPCLYANF